MKVAKEDLQRPFTALLIAPTPGAHHDVLEGMLSATVRMEHRDYVTGERVMLCCHLQPFAVMATVQRVRHCTVKQLKQEQLERAGYKTHRDLLDALRTFYPKLCSTSKITYIAWKSLEGELVETHRRLKALTESAKPPSLDTLRTPMTDLSKV